MHRYSSRHIKEWSVKFLRSMLSPAFYCIKNRTPLHLRKPNPGQWVQRRTPNHSALMGSSAGGGSTVKGWYGLRAFFKRQKWSDEIGKRHHLIFLAQTGTVRGFWIRRNCLLTNLLDIFVAYHNNILILASTWTITTSGSKSLWRRATLSWQSRLLFFLSRLSMKSSVFIKKRNLLAKKTSNVESPQFKTRDHT